MNPDRIEKIVIVGGGTAGWIAAAALSHTFKDCKITLIESSEIGTIGVGEATIPPIINFLNYLGVNETEFMQFTHATFKLGIKFKDWRVVGEEYWHPFGFVGANIDGKPFFHHWLKSSFNGSADRLTDFAPAARMADANKFYPHHKAQKDSFLAGATYAYHFDANLVAHFLRDFSEHRGVARIDDQVVDTVLKDNGFIDSVILKSGQKISGDLFIDCSGFSGLLIEKTLHAGYEDWSDYLPCDKAVAMPTANVGDVPPYTLASAKDSGWTWKIPLTHRTGNGYVYASQFCSEDQAIQTLRQSVEGEILAEPRTLKFTTGYRKSMWINNCVAIGLASGFIEPLESTAIQLIVKGVRTLLELFPDKDCHPSLAKEYDRLMMVDYESIRDFVVLHYCVTNRSDTEFWRWCRNEMRVPESLQQKIELFKAQGRLQRNPMDLFKEPSWYFVLLGMGVKPGSYDPMVDETDFSKAEDVIKQIKDLMRLMVSDLPSHQAYLNKYILQGIKQ